MRQSRSYNRGVAARTKPSKIEHANAVPAKAYFTAGALDFLRKLKRNNRREWFEARRDVYEQELKRPMLALIERLTHGMMDYAPDHIRPPQKCMLRIYRDTRFSADKTPYKTNLAAWWTRNGLEKTSGGGYYLHLSATELVIAVGVYMPPKEQMFAIRQHLLEQHAEFRRLIENKKGAHEDGLARSLHAYASAERLLRRGSRDRMDQVAAVGPDHPAARCRGA